MLRLDNIHAAYGLSDVLFGVELNIEQGEVVSLLGRNGMGKTTTVRTICGILTPKSGDIDFLNQHVNDWPAYRMARAGVGLVPEGRQIFPNLTVKENLIATRANKRGNGDGWKLDSVLDLFPGLRPRLRHLGNHLSGGEQQMLAIGRALMTNPLLLILDEATEGLAPLIREEIWSCLQKLKDADQSILVIDKNLDALLRICDRHYIMEKGRIVWHGDSATLKSDNGIHDRYLGV